MVTALVIAGILVCSWGFGLLAKWAVGGKRLTDALARELNRCRNLGVIDERIRASYTRTTLLTRI